MNTTEHNRAVYNAQFIARNLCSPLLQTFSTTSAFDNVAPKSDLFVWMIFNVEFGCPSESYGISDTSFRLHSCAFSCCRTFQVCPSISFTNSNYAVPAAIFHILECFCLLLQIQTLIIYKFSSVFIKYFFFNLIWSLCMMEIFVCLYFLVFAFQLSFPKFDMYAFLCVDLVWQGDMKISRTIKSKGSEKYIVEILYLYSSSLGQDLVNLPPVHPTMPVVNATPVYGPFCTLLWTATS